MTENGSDQSPAQAGFPSFCGIEHPSLPDWMLKGLDRLFSLEPRIDRMHIDLWPVSSYNDHIDIDVRGGMVLNTSETVPEEALDEIPAVRMFERRAVEMWEYVPLQICEDENASVNGEYDFYAERGRILFEYRTNDDLSHVMVIEAVHENGAWQNRDRIVLTTHDGSASDILAGTPAAVLAVYSEDELLLASMPETVSVEVGDDGEVVVHLKPGEFTRCMPKR